MLGNGEHNMFTIGNLIAYQGILLITLMIAGEYVSFENEPKLIIAILTMAAAPFLFI
jgi:hypothetical protein